MTPSFSFTDTPDGHKIRRSPDGKLSVFDLLKAAGAKNPRDLFTRLSKVYPDTVAKCDSVKLQREDGKKANLPTPVCDEAVWRRIMTVLPGVMGAQYREAANTLVDLFFAADITVAESIVTRNKNPKDHERLQARMDGIKVRNKFTGTIAKHGGGGGRDGAYAQTSIATCKGVTGHSPSSLCAQRGLARGKTRDGFTTEELVRTAYIEQISTVAMDANNVQGDREIIDTHKEVVELEGALFRRLTMKRPA